MITKPRDTEVPPPEFWGKVKGFVRYIHIEPGGQEAIYVLEESPGWREIRYNSRKYRIFFPWIYLFVKVLKSCETPEDCKLYAFVSKKQAKDIKDECLLLAPFPSAHQGGAICMPSGSNKSSTPIECALQVAYQFWYANSTELDVYGTEMVPERLTKGVKVGARGKVFGNWSKLSPVESLNLEYEKSGEPSIINVCESMDWVI